MRPDWFVPWMRLRDVKGYKPEQVGEIVYKLGPRLYCVAHCTREDGKTDKRRGPFVTILGVGETDTAARHHFKLRHSSRELPELTYPAPLEIPRRTYGEWRKALRGAMQYASYRHDGKFLEKTVAGRARITGGRSISVCFTGNTIRKMQLPYFVEIR